MNLLPYFVYAVNSVTYVKDAVVFFCECVYEGYSTKYWAFAKRNSYPIIVSSSWKKEEVMLTYSPDTFMFGELIGDKITLDVVTAELKTPYSTYDLSSFLYSVKWGSVAPSLYELVLLYLLHEKICLSIDMLDLCSLNILTSDADEHVVEMNSVLAKQSFRGFSEGTTEGLTEGLTEGTTEGLTEGTTEGLTEGTTEGLKVD